MFIDSKVRVIETEVHIQPGQRILDLGCGTGDRSSIFPTEGFVGVDIDQQVTRFARRRYGRDFLQMDALQLGLKRSSVDWILAIGLFHHLSDEDTLLVLDEAKRVLKNHGKMLALTVIWPLSRWDFVGWTVRKLDRGDYIRTSDEFAKLFSIHFDIEKHYIFRAFQWDIGAFVLFPRM